MADLDNISLETFRLWSSSALKAYLALRKKSVDGTFDELTARAFCVWEEKVPTDLCAEHAERQLLTDYKKKLVIESNILPDPISLKDGWSKESTGMTRWPSLYFIDIANYLNTKNPQELVHRLMNEYKEGKAYRYFTCEWVKEIQFHPIGNNSPFCILKADVSPSQRVNNKPYQVWAVVRKDTEQGPGECIVSAYCTCTAGMLGSCNHIAGMLFRVEAAVKAGMTKPACTSQKSKWNVPGKTTCNKKPTHVSSVSWTKDHFKNINMDLDKKKNREKKQSFTPLTKEQVKNVKDSKSIREKLLQVVKRGANDSCFVQIMERKRHVVKKEECPPSIVEVSEKLRQTDCSAEKLDDLRQQLLDQLMLSEEEISVLQKSTASQSASDEWRKQRQGRITASIFYRAYTRSKTLQRDRSADPSSLIACVMGYTDTPTTTAMKHGISMEPHAKATYIALMKKAHKNLCASNVYISVLSDKPYISASADLLTSCKCCGLGLCEIKCPEKIKDQIPKADNISYIEKDEDGLPELKKCHPYYCQIQGQMGILNRKFCDLFIYTVHGQMQLRIKFDEECWQDLLENLDWFWKNYISKELLTQEIKKMVTQPNTQKPINPRKRKNQPETTKQILDLTPCSKKQKMSTSKKPKANVRDPVFLCGYCGTQCEEEPAGAGDCSVQCDKCNMWIHFKCAKIKKGSAPADDDQWVCCKCS